MLLRIAHHTQTFALVFLVLGCESTQDVGSADDGGTGDSGGGAVPGLLCSTSNPCPAGEFCFNGLCALGCNSNGDCAMDQYCDTEFDRLCHNKTVSTCPEAPCASNQSCVQGLCSTSPVSTTACQPSPDGSDGCDTYALCIDVSETETEEYACHTFPACGQDGSCPVGTVGAVCNSGIIANKAHFCLTGLCQEAVHCPTDWHCVRGNAAEVLGFCGSGAFGSPCAAETDCLDSLSCYVSFPGFPGFCT